jgi:inhibitor of cysteine peptidase
MAGRYFLSLARATVLAGAWLMYSAGAVFPEEALKTMRLLAETDNDRTVDIRLGETVRVTLAENATTGYRWAIDRYDEEFVEALGTDARYPSNRIGAGGEVTFDFQGRKIGTGEIVLKEWRHWEGDSSVTKRFRVRLHVQP